MTSQTIGISWVRNAAEASAYTWLENLSGYNDSGGTYSGHCNQTHGAANQALVTTYLNSVSPFSGMRRCNITSNGIITAVQNSAGTGCGYTATPSTPTNQVGWILPAFYYYTNHTPGSDDTYRWYISPAQDLATANSRDTVGGSAVTWKLHPAFSRGGVAKPYIVLGAYEGIVSGTTPTFYLNSTGANTTQPTTSGNPPASFTANIASFRTAANNVGTGWGIQDFNSLAAVQLSYLLEFGGFNSQVLLGGGYTATTLQNTGTTAANGNATVGTTASYTTPVSYRGLENPYGNIYKFIDGINIKSYDPWIADNGFTSAVPAFYTAPTPYIDTGLAIGQTAGYAGNITTTATYDYGFLPAATGGSASTQLCDYFNPATGNVVMYHGGSYNIGGTDAYAGMFYYNMLYGNTTTGAGLGARLMYIPQ